MGWMSRGQDRHGCRNQQATAGLRFWWLKDDSDAARLGIPLQPHSSARRAGAPTRSGVPASERPRVTLTSLVKNAAADEGVRAPGQKCRGGETLRLVRRIRWADGPVVANAELLA